MYIGNPNNITPRPRGNVKVNIGTILGLSIGIPIGLSCLGILLLSILYRRRDRLEQALENSNKKLEYEQHADNNEGSEHATNIGNYVFESDYDFAPPSKPIQMDTYNWHVRTPRKAHAGPSFLDNNGKTVEGTNNLSAGNKLREVDDILYRRPPNIYSIKSSISSKADIIPRRPKKQRKASNWKYESPLSKWFLRSSLYLRNLSDNQVSTANMKNTNILTSVIEGWASPAEVHVLQAGIDDETSEHTLDSSGPSSKNSGDKSTVESSVIVSQTVHIDEELYPEMTLDPRIKSKKKETRSKLQRHMEYVSMMKPLPLTPRSRPSENQLTVGRVYSVVEGYNPLLPDEICVVPGEKLRLLAKHSAGWCLVERETVVNGSQYLNNDRGIIPIRSLYK
ncbi:hypothetical protein RNJ44_03028 [Nakaseomyces bracarensis]|uniref:SH3 domain-containing protein n=1 Tax=Nakaseomyces bracarensis TaxID=273131 RepID=A0ABR4NYL6_9SACH